MSKTIVIVGASRGIGNELVKLFAAQSSNLVIALARNVDKMKNDFSAYTNVSSFGIDLGSKQLKQKLTTIFQQIDTIDILINNAGLLVNKPFLELTREDITTCYDINVIGVMETVQVAIPKMLNGGHIVNISSMGGFQGSVKFAGLSAYSTSKAAVVSFTELFAEEYKESKIKMNCLCLGAVQTEMLAEAFPGYEAPLSASEMAGYIHEFALNGSKFMNGKVIPVSLSTP